MPHHFNIPPARRRGVATVVAGAVLTTPVIAQQSAEDLAKSLANPIAALISVPFQFNYDHEIGPSRDGDRWTLNIQPVIPITLNAEWNVISRTILPVASSTSRSDEVPYMPVLS